MPGSHLRIWRGPSAHGAGSPSLWPSGEVLGFGHPVLQSNEHILTTKGCGWDCAQWRGGGEAPAACPPDTLTPGHMPWSLRPVALSTPGVSVGTASLPTEPCPPFRGRRCPHTWACVGGPARGCLSDSQAHATPREPDPRKRWGAWSSHPPPAPAGPLGLTWAPHPPKGLGQTGFGEGARARGTGQGSAGRSWESGALCPVPACYAESRARESL